MNRRVVVAVALALLAASCMEEPDKVAQEVVSEAAAELPEATTPPPAPPAATPPVAPLLRAAAGGDGDSWRDSQGREYRLGLVNAPETSECFGSAATAKRKQLVADGFQAQVYATDTYDRAVAVVTTASGTNVNVYLARHGYANDKYLAEFRHENPGLATELDAAFAAAKRERVGLWGACVKPAPRPVAPQPARGDCDPSYPTVCIPSPPPDLDCGEITHRRFQVVGSDPHRFDADNDGIGCESG